MQKLYKSKILRVLVIVVFAFSVCSSYLTANAETRKKYIAAGIPFGISINTEGVLVSGYSEINGRGIKDNPAYNAGIKLGDVIVSINGTKTEKVSVLTELINQTSGQTAEIELNRNNNLLIIQAKPEKCDDGIFRLGINVKDEISGIGTVTYICPEDKSFGGLGHGICDTHTGYVIPMKNGVITDVKINNIVKGSNGIPGEIRGSFSTNRIGTAKTNSEFGIYGHLQNHPNFTEQLYEAATENDITCGNAQIICTLDSNGPQTYSIQIESFDLDKNVKTRNYVIRVTDKELLKKTGGIIQGMSGSPIIQNGKLVGAVTHVLVNDPTRGYGIFIENMLGASPSTTKEEHGYAF